MHMEKAIQYGVIVLLTAGFNQVCEAQSKEETLQWIKARLPYAAASKHNPDGYKTGTLAYHDVVANGCSLIFVEKKAIAGYGESHIVETSVTVPLGQLSVVDSVTGADDGWEGDSVELKAFDKIITEKWTVQKYEEGRPPGTESGSRSESEYYIVTSDSDLAKRLAKALAHANEVCGAKKETF